MSKKITIIGGGLAGVSLGVGLRRRGVPVHLIEAGRYPRHRVCGEFISGVSDEALEILGIGSAFDDMPRHRHTVWYHFSDRVFDLELPIPAVGVSRYKLDQDLIDLFTASGGELSTGTRFKDPVEAGQVYATGRVRSKQSQWVGIKCHLLNFPLETDLEMHIGHGCYLGLSEVEDNRVDACGLFRIRPNVKAPKLELMNAYLEACGLDQLAKRIRTAEKDEASCLGVNAFDLGWQDSPTDNKLRIGDSFAIIGPFSGNGMSMAFESAAMAVEPLTSWFNDELDWVECRSEINQQMKRRFRKRLAISNWIHPFLTSPKRQKFIMTLGKRQLIPYASLYKALR